MNLKVVGPRLLVKIKKFKKDATYEGSSIIMAASTLDQETINQSIGEVVQVGDEAYKNKVTCPSGTSWVQPGDVVHFSRYGAMRINPKMDEDWEYWVLMDKDVLVIEQKEDVQQNNLKVQENAV